MLRLLALFWDQKEVFTYQNGYHDSHFKGTGGDTQGGLIYPTIFNLIVYNVLRNCLAMTV